MMRALWALPGSGPILAGLAPFISVLTAILLWHTSAAVATYDPSRPHTVENFDPAEADPQGGVTCLGPLPPWPLPVYPGFNPNTFSLQELCNKPQYGGKGPGRHLGGWCMWNRHPQSPGVWGVDRGVGALANAELASRTRLLLYCRQRCFCDFEVEDRSHQPYRTARDYEVVSLPRWNFEIINVHVPSIDGLEPASRDAKPVYRLGTRIRDQEEIHVFGQRLKSRWASINSVNDITCEGNLPEWPRMPSFDSPNPPTLQQLCAVQLSGGNTSANFGGYCHPDGTGKGRVWFTDEMTPRIEYTWENSVLSAAFRRYCWSQCRCTNLPELEKDKSKPWFILDGVGVATRADNGVDFIVRGELGSKAQPVYSMVPSSGSSSDGSCQTREGQSCNATWPVDVLGPVPRAPPAAYAGSVHDTDLSTAEGTWTPPSGLPTCGSACQNNKACRGPDPTSKCRCMAVGEPVARANGLDPVFPSALCLVFSQALASSLAKVGKGSPKRRAVDDVKGQVWGCACNNTYISLACCESDTDVVHETSVMKLGRLHNV
ncbi:MAG: hypothetical protein M1817_002041 [Caeruleum heppii]|nr:MAG: hypothetical protein M1817_002041 [Caeruleum heppii]